MRLLFAVAAVCALTWSATPKGPASLTLQTVPVFVSVSNAAGQTTGNFHTIERFQPLTAAQAGALIPTGDGSRLLLLRFRSRGATAVRLHIGNMHLPQGSRLFVYGIRDGVITDFTGPYEGAGPTPEDHFWTDAVPGPEAVVEYQADARIPADLPFQVLELAWAESSETRTATRIPTEVRTSIYRGTALTHEVENGIAIFEGDIILGSADELLPASGKKSSAYNAVSISDVRYRWPQGTVPYFIDPSLPNPSRIADAISHWNTAVPGHVRLVPRTSEANYIVFQGASSVGTCSSYVGMLGIGAQMLQVGDNCSTGNIIHEIGHAVGLWHEQSREDRNRFVRILWENIQPTKEYNFSQNNSMGEDIGNYDLGSIMHYGAYSFSANGQPTIESIPAGIPIGQRTSLSSGDIDGIRRLYPASTSETAATTPVRTVSTDITVRTNPENLPITVDSVTYTSPQTFKWQVGSVHTIEASAPTPGLTRYLFHKWSDGGAQSHSVSASSAVSVYTADLAVGYKVEAEADRPGIATISPSSSDDYYPANSLVNLTATAPPEYCFTGWTGLLAGTAPTTSLTVTKPYTLKAGFQRGSIGVQSSNVKVPPAGGQVSIGVNADSGCVWTIESSSSWFLVLSGSSGNGTGVITISAGPNTGTTTRTGVLVVGGASVDISQPASHVRGIDNERRSPRSTR